jgi:hypothetical protein
VKQKLRALAILILAGAAARADSRSQEFSDFVTPLPVRPGEALVLGVVGGWERWDNPVRCVRRTAIAVKRRRLPGVHVETVENHKLELAVELVRRAFDLDRDGTLSTKEARAARVAVFGQSLGGRAALRLCRELEKMGVPVRIAVIVDAYGSDSYVVPANVLEAANFYQRDHLFIRGAPEITAADPAKTRILGNWRSTYRGREIDAGDDTEAHRRFMGAHTLMEYDMELWARVEDLLARAVSAGSGSRD